MIPTITVVITLLVNPDLFLFTKIQLVTSFDTPSNFHEYFNSYWNGRITSDNFFFKILNFIPSFLGFYFITPNYNMKNEIILYIWIVLIALWSLAIIIQFIYSVFVSVKDATKIASYEKNYVTITALSGIIIVTVFGIKGSYWTMGKIMIWISMFTYLMWIIPALDFIKFFVVSKKIDMLNKILFLVGVLVVVFNLCFAGARIVILSSENKGIGYTNNYPSIQQPWVKKDYIWNFNPNRFPKRSIIQVETDNWLYNMYIAEKLWYNDLEYMSTGFYEKDKFTLEIDAFNEDKIPDGAIIVDAREIFGESIEPIYLTEGLDSTNWLRNNVVDFTQTLPYYIKTQGIGGNESSGRWTNDYKASIIFMKEAAADDLLLEIDVKDRIENQEITIEINGNKRTTTIKDIGNYKFHFGKVEGVKTINFYIPNAKKVEENSTMSLGVFINAVKFINVSN